MTADPVVAWNSAPRARAEGVLARLGHGRAGPIRLAVALAVVAWPFVAISFLLPPLFEIDAGFQSPGMVEALVVAKLKYNFLTEYAFQTFLITILGLKLTRRIIFGT